MQDLTDMFQELLSWCQFWWLRQKLLLCWRHDVMPGAHCIPRVQILWFWDSGTGMPPGQAVKGGAEKRSCSLPSQVDVVWTQISCLRHNLSLKLLKKINGWVGLGSLNYV